MADMEVKVGAEVSGAIAGLNQLQNKLDQTGKAAIGFDDDIQKAASKLRQLPSVTNQATLVDNIIGATAIAEPAYIQFNVNSVPSIAVGRIGWNDTDKTLELGMTPTVNQNVGQELFILAKSSDNTERTKGKAVYITGSDGNNKLVYLMNK